MDVGHMSRVQEFFCALAGPLAGFSLLLVARWLPRTAVCGFIQAAYNLLPVYPLDGGRMICSLGVGEKGRRWIEYICLFSIGMCGIYGSFILRLGMLPILCSILIIRRVLAGKGLENSRGFRYNKERIYE